MGSAESQGGWQPNPLRGTPEWKTLERTLGADTADELTVEAPVRDNWYSFKARPLPELTPEQQEWADKARAVARDAGIDPDLFARQMWQESSFDPDVIYGRRASSAGALGIAQLVPRWHPNVDWLDPDQALPYAARLMRHNIDTYGDPRRALIAYNGGQGGVEDYNEGVFFDPHFPNAWAETKGYLNAILENPY